ncbi:MAG: ABC transporter substrate-binding protein [Paludibacteraceae bacterium]|jgi:iron complex transport system substrate-binding protein|nr:ABC transporter substrate-binding protein [Prevotellaceae bacterium]
MNKQKRDKTIRNLSILLSLFLPFLFTNCSKQKTDSNEGTGTEIKFTYAKQIKAFKYPDFTKVEVLNPWDSSKTLQTYYLIPQGREMKEEKRQGTVIRTPITKSVIYASVHCALISELNAYDAIAGVCDLKHIHLESIQEGCRTGKIADLGDGMNPDIEQIIDMRPEAMFISPFENSGGHGRIEKIGIPIFECADYMENTALGRAEWIKIYGMMFGREREADSIFKRVEAVYLFLHGKAIACQPHPSVIYGLKSGSAWYVPGGKCFISQMFADAGANYIFQDDKHNGSVPLSFETVFEKGCDADIWLFMYNRKKDMTYKDLREEHATYSQFRAFKKKQIYACNTGNIPFYEETPFHPELYLQDLINIFHPELRPKDYGLQYFSKLAE